MSFYIEIRKQKMMSNKEILSKIYSPAEVENKIYKLWIKSRAFHAKPDKRLKDNRYVVMMPLPNVTGALHMGHAMDNVMQDLLIRWHRMKGDNTLWMPGTDHAGIATQAVVEKRLKELEDLTRYDIGREGLIKRIWKWKDQYQQRIIKQQQRMGCSCDWDRQRFTMDKVCARAVRFAFFRMFQDGLIFRGKRLVNWDIFLQTTISDDEMYHETVDGHFWHLVYPVIDPKEGEPKEVIVATTRPETMLGDTAVAVHPNPEAALSNKIAGLEKSLSTSLGNTKEDLETELNELKQRQKTILPILLKLKKMAEDGRKINLPLLNRPIPLILDEWAKPELGSGCVKITPAHDYNDYDVWMRHKDKIDIINILNPDGSLNTNAGPYAGMDRLDARFKVVSDLESQDLLKMIEDRKIEIGHSDRSKTQIEPFLSDQWFIKMGDTKNGVILGQGTHKKIKSPGLVQAAIDAVVDGRVKIHPERYKKTYLDWLEEKRDWPISRQLWWGHRIPVWSKTNKKSDLDLELLFTAIKKLFKKRKDAENELLIKFNSLETEESFLVKGSDLINYSIPDWPGHMLSRIDICLLKDNDDILDILESNGFKQDNDVLDTWFSSALWPFSTLGWPEPATAEVDNKQAPLGAQEGSVDCLEYYYPGSCLVTARDIITLWVARMVLAGLYCLGDIPFTDVFIHANILDGKGVRMSKSKGNGIDPVDIIETYGADAMRYVLCDMQTGTQDIRLPVTAICPECRYNNDLGITQHGSSIFCYVCGKNPDGSVRKDACGKEFDVLGTLPNLKQAKLVSKRFENGQFFCTKLWNSARFAFMNMKNASSETRKKDDLAFEDRWILSRLSQTIKQVTGGLENYNPSFALGSIRDFFWSCFCDWYLELIKTRLQNPEEKTGSIALQVLALCMDQLLRLLHPFIPYITEELWQHLNIHTPERGLGNLAPVEVTQNLINASWPSPFSDLEDKDTEEAFLMLQEIVRAVREVRAERTIPPKQNIHVTIKPKKIFETEITEYLNIMKSLAGIEKLHINAEATRMKGSATKLTKTCLLFVHDVIDDEAEKKHLNKALSKVEEEINICNKKLNNTNFTEKAPKEVVNKQRERLLEYQANKEKILSSLKELEESL